MTTMRAILPAAILLLGSGAALAWPHGKADTDGDGAISKSEMKEMRLKMFDRMDADDDGYVTREEIRAKKEKMAEKRKEADKEGDKKQPRKGGAWLEKLDADDDGRISRDEMADAPLPMFDKADADGDGKLTREEMKAMHDKHRSKHKQHSDQKP